MKISLLLALACTANAVPYIVKTDTADGAGIQIHLKWKNDPNLCVAVADLKNVSSPNGVSVTLEMCNKNTSNTIWTLSTWGDYGTLRPTAIPTHCLDVMNGNPANGNRLQLWDCNTPTPASQHFMIVSDRILWRQKCLQVDQAVIGSPTGAAVQLWDCNHNDQTSKFIGVTVPHVQRVCVFDIDGTTLQAGCTSAGPAYAIQQCYENGYSIAINTAESSDQAKANKDNLVAIGVPRSVVDNPATYRSMLSGFDKPGSKVQNMFDIMGYTGAKQGCVLLFDDEKGNVDAVNKAGFPTVRAGTQGCLLSMDEVWNGLQTLATCGGQ